MRSQLAVSSASCLRPGLGQPVELRAPVVVRVAPRRLDPALLLEPVERRVEGPLIDLEDILRHLLQALGDAPSMHVARRQRAENEEVERALEEVALFACFMLLL